MSAVPPAIEVRHLVRKFGSRTVLNDVNFVLPRGETLVIMGGSGCGKSTLLRHLIGALKPNSGEILIQGKEITRMNETQLALVRRRFGMLFQTGALFNSLTVGENVALPIMESSDVAANIAELVVKMKLELVGLTGFEHLKPAEISGGMKKRVGLARAIALDPDLLFCDEPTAGLDPVMTAVVDTLLLDLTKKLGITAVVVTHDMTSAFRIASRMIMLFEGRVIAAGTPDEIKNNPDPVLRQFIHGEADGPIPLKLSKDDYLKRLMSGT
jgi:phospholipid/cholesterol/gamma-HCH transport system ATP-binding protein